MYLRNQPKLPICCLLIMCMVLFAYQSLWAQNFSPSNIDQLTKQLDTAKTDKDKIVLLRKITQSLAGSDHQKALQYAAQMIALTEKSGSLQERLNNYLYLGELCDAANDFGGAVHAYEKAYELAQADKLTSLQYTLLLRKGLANRTLKNYDQALRDFKNVMEFYQQSKSFNSSKDIVPPWWYSALMAGSVYSAQKDEAGGVDFYNQLLNRYLQEKDTVGIRTTFRLFVFFYNSVFRRNFNKALEYALQELKYFKKEDTSIAYADALILAAELYKDQKNYVKALEYHRAAIALKPDPHGEIKERASRGMRNIYVAVGDFKTALSIDLEQVRYTPTIELTQMIVEDYIQLKQYGQALVYLEKLVQEQGGLYASGNKPFLNPLTYVYYLNHRYDEAMHTVKISLSNKEGGDFDSDWPLSLLYSGMIVRDAPDEVLKKYDIPPVYRYQQAIKSLLLALDYKGKTRKINFLQECYKELSATYEMMNDYKGFHDNYKSYIFLRDSSIDREKQNAFLNKVAELQFEKKEDSLQYQQRLTEEKLQQQTLLSSQQHQTLLLNQQKFALLGKEKDLQQLNYLKTQSDLQAEQNRRRANEKQLSLSQKEQVLAQTTVQLQKAELKGKQAQSRYLLAGIAALLILSFFIARNYYNQRRSNQLLTTANTQITQANQDITAANQQIYAEKQRSDNLLLNILPADVAEELKEKGSAGARLFDHVTVLFTDFVNFTTIGELLTPQELVDELHHCFKAFDEIIGRYGIEKIKTIGDAYLAVAGLPNADPQHAYNTVKAALEINQFIHTRKNQMGNRSFDIRIGIHSGSVVAGIVGVKKFAYDIWGDTVNTAARMEQHSLPGQINLSEKTYELVKDLFVFTYRGEIEAKNKGALKMYFVEKQTTSMVVNG